MPTCQGEEQWIKRKRKCRQKTLFNNAPKSLQIQPVRRDGVLETRSGGSTTPPVRSMQQQSSGRGRGHWDQEEIRRRALSPSDFPWGEVKSNPSTGGVTVRRIVDEPSSISNGQGPTARKPIPATAGRNVSGGTQGRSGKSGSNKGGVPTLQEGRPSKSGNRGRARKFSQSGRGGLSQSSLPLSRTGASSATGPLRAIHIHSRNDGAQGTYWVPGSVGNGVVETIPQGIRLPGEGDSKISGLES